LYNALQDDLKYIGSIKKWGGFSFRKPSMISNPWK
jgi:hypothetical protein